MNRCPNPDEYEDPEPSGWALWNALNVPVEQLEKCNGCGEYVVGEEDEELRRER